MTWQDIEAQERAEREAEEARWGHDCPPKPRYSIAELCAKVRDEALEEAARVCDQHECKLEAGHVCAEAIARHLRSLKGGGA